jgi:membrane-bound ClpP family serine protease
MLEELSESLFSNLKNSLPQISSFWFQIEPWLIPLIAIATAAFLIIAIIWGIRAHRKSVSAGREDLIGRTTVVDIALGHKGIVLVEGERWTAILDGGHAQPEEKVIITKVEGLKLWVTMEKTA